MSNDLIENIISTVIGNILSVEKGYIDNSNDNGGPTNFGITQLVARANGFKEDMRNMPRSFAESIYRKRYISEPKFDKLLEIDVSVGSEVIDTGVNMGPATAAMLLQRWLNGFNKLGSGYADLFVDGRLGPMSFDALNRFGKLRGKDGFAVLVTALNASQGARYLEISEANKSQREFLYGWVAQRVKI